MPCYDVLMNNELDPRVHALHPELRALDHHFIAFHTDKYGNTEEVLVMFESDTHWAGDPIKSAAILFKAPKTGNWTID